jgi:hypothetical protein
MSRLMATSKPRVMRCLSAAVIGLLALLAGSADAATPAPQHKLFPGTYRQINTVTKQTLPVGSQIVIIAGKGGRLGFSLNAVRQMDANQGFAVGILPATLPAVWTKTADSGNCKLTLESVPNNGLAITQDTAFGDCGFGSGVTATGTYQLVPETPLKP